MSLGGGKIDQATFSQQMYTAGIRIRIFVNKIAHATLVGGQRFQSVKIELIVEVPEVIDESTVFHTTQMLTINDIDITNYCNENIAKCRRFHAWHHTIAVHHGF